MGSLSNYAENAFLNHLFGTAHSPAANLYLALCTADPTDAGTGASMNEVADANNYARAAITFDAAASRKVIQAAAISFNQASGSWGTISHWAIVDSNTHGAGNMLAYGAFSSSFSVVSGNTPSIADESVQIEISASSGEGFTTAFVHSMLNLMFRNSAYAQPSVYIGLMHFVAADANTTISGEVTGTDYARVQVRKSGEALPTWETVSGGAVQNANAITFPTVGAGGWTEVVGVVIVDSATLGEGNVLMFDNDQVVDQTPNAGDTVQFATGAFDISLT